MEKECMNCGGSIYFQCRKEAAKYNDRLSSREGASEMLNVSVSSLSNYELGLTPVPTDVVVRMADLYGAPELEACYCKNDCPIGKRQNIATKIRGIEQITCSLLNHAGMNHDSTGEKSKKPDRLPDNSSSSGSMGNDNHND